VSDYIGQCWRNDVSADSRIPTLTGLEIIMRDLRSEAVHHPEVGRFGPLEIWTNPETGTTGFYMGNTAALAGEGWIQLASILGKRP
jgi:hypothetical protein